MGWCAWYELNVCGNQYQDLDLTRVLRDFKYLTIETVLRKFRKTLLSEIEDLASPDSKLSESFGQSIPKPFSVVSVIRGSDNDHKESGHEVASSDEYEEDNELESSKHEWPKVAGYDEKKTKKFLQEQMRRDATLTNQVSSTEYDETKALNFLQEKMKMMGMDAFTVDETIKIAISAFQHLFQKQFKANEIEVTVMDPSYFVSIDEADYKDIYVKELEMSDIEDHLAAINEPSGSVGSLCVGSRSGGFLNADFRNGGASMPQVSVSLTSIMALCEERFVLMAVDSRATTYEFFGGQTHDDDRRKLINVGRAVVAAGTGQTDHIRIVKDTISTAMIQHRIADVGTLELVARIFTAVVNFETSRLGLDFSLPVNYLAFMVSGFVQNTRGIFLIERDADLGRFVAKPSPSQRVCYLGSGAGPNARYQLLHPLPDQWSAVEALDYCVKCMEATFLEDPNSGGKINFRAIYGSDSPGGEFAFEERVYGGQRGYYPVL